VNDRRHDVFAHLNVDRARLYRAILAAFVRAKQGFALHLRPADVERALVGNDAAAEPGTLGNALAQLVSWGNLEAHPDTADVATVEEFYRTRHLYQLSRAGEAAERAIAFFEQILDQAGELQAVALGDIRVLLAELLELGAAEELDAGKAHRALLALRARFDELVARAQAFMGSLQRTIDLHGLSAGDLVAYKEALVDYLERFIGELLMATAEIAGVLARLDGAPIERILAAVAERELADAVAPTPEDRAAAEAAWGLRWTGLRSWFLGASGTPSQSEVLRQRARSAIPALLSAIAGLNDRRVARSDRAADLRALAMWFAEAPDDRSAHRLWRAAFALAPARHLTVDEATLAAREVQPVVAHTSWLEAPPIGISPRLRESGRWTRPGPASRVIDRSRERAELERLMAEEAAQIEAARRRLATGRRLRLSELGVLGRREFDLLLDLIGEALAARGRGGVVDVASSDGSLVIRLEDPQDGRTTIVETVTGRLSAPDFFVTIRDGFTSDGALAS
jgi:uncharacterized protein (TIGR02677 family)